MDLSTLKKKISTLVEKVRHKKADGAESNKAQEGNTGDLGETVTLVAKPDDYDEKKDKHDDEIKSC